MPGHGRGHCCERCKNGSTNWLAFGLWTRVGRRKHKLNRIREVVPVCPHRKEHWRRVHWSHLANMKYINILWHSFNFCMCRSCCSSFTKLVGWHSDERWSELIITCSFRDFKLHVCILILYTFENLLELC